jgi:hypothetical protein
VKLNISLLRIGVSLVKIGFGALKLDSLGIVTDSMDSRRMGYRDSASAVEQASSAGFAAIFAGLIGGTGRAGLGCAVRALSEYLR